MATTTNVPRSFRTALETRDSAAAAALMADEVVFRSPVVFKPYNGRDTVQQIMAAVFQVFDDWRCVRELGTPDGRDHALVFEARIGDRQLEGCDFLRLDKHRSIEEFYVMVRPLSGALALAEAMKAQLSSARESAPRRYPAGWTSITGADRTAPSPTGRPGPGLPS